MDNSAPPHRTSVNMLLARLSSKEDRQVRRTGLIVSPEPPELVALKRALGRRLAAARQAAEIGQQQVAHKTGYSRSSVAHAEAGRQLLTRDFWTTADELVNADGALLAGYDQVHVAKQEHDRRSREAELAKAYAEAKALRATASLPQAPWDADQLTMPTAQDILASLIQATGLELAEGLVAPLAVLTILSSPTQTISAEWEDRLCAQLKNVLGEWANTMNRREVLRLLGWAAAIVAASPMGGLDADDQQRLTQAIALPSRVDTQVIDSLEAMFGQCKRQEDALGSRLVLDTVLAQRRLIHRLLKDCPAPLRPRLLSVYSDMSTSIGYYFFELNDLNNARYFCEQARVAAHDAGDTGLSIYALCEMSYFASWQGKAPVAIDFAAAAESFLPKTDDPLMQVGVAQRAATAYATDGQYDRCMERLEKAQEKLASSGQVSVESSLYFYNEGYLASHKSECLLRLRRPQEAAASATAGLALYDKSFIDGYAVCNLHLGNAYLQAGEIDEAAQVISRAATLSVQTHSARLVKELRTARNQMEPWRQTRAVRELDERLVGMRFEV